MGLSTSQLRSAWAPPCNSGAFVTVNLNGEGRVTIDPRVGEATHALNAILTRWNYATRRNDTGAYNCRKITGGSGYSLHAYGIALDINWTTNPYGPNLVTDMPQGMVNEITALRTNNGKRVWEWGGSWSGNKDAMHYEVDCSPADLATGIAGSQAPTPVPPTTTTTLPGEPTMFLSVHSIGLYALIGHVLFEFQEFDEYVQATESSPKVPIMGIGDAVPMGGRQWLVDRLNEQSIRVNPGVKLPGGSSHGWAGATAFVVATFLSIGWAAAMVAAALDDDVSDAGIQLLSSLGGVLAGSVAGYLGAGAALLWTRRHQENPDDT